MTKKTIKAKRAQFVHCDSQLLKMTHSKRVKFRNIGEGQVGPCSGVYAWYYTHKISIKDVQRFIATIESEESLIKKKEYIRSFAEKNFFNLYLEPPYQVTLEGKLKARYFGAVEHQAIVSSNVIDRLIEDPSSLYEFRELIELSGTEFSSPLYIGMSKNLLQRLTTHKKMIEKYAEKKSFAYAGNGFDDSEEVVKDESFARRVVERKFNIANLYVVIKEIESEKNQHNLFENLFNRITYPILGRN